MRRKDREIADQNELINFLCTQDVGTLAVNSENGPYGVPLNYLYHEGIIYFHSALSGKKLDCIRKDNRVCFTVMEVGPQALWGTGVTQIYKSVMCFGTVEIITDQALKKEILTRLVEKFVPPRYNYSFTKDGLMDKTHVLKLSISSMSGKENKLTADHTVIE